MREKLELVIAKFAGEYEEDTFGHRSASREYKSWERRFTDAILEALAEPSEAMKEKAWHYHDGRVYSCHVCGGQEEGWHLMLKAAGEE